MIDEQQLLVDDLQGSRALVAAGWARRRLIREDHVGKVTVCPLGAIGLTTEGRKFRSWALNHPRQGHVEWKWSPRAQVVMDALRPHVVKVANDPVFTDTAPIVNLIANTNDVCVTHRRAVLGWFDAAIADARSELEKEEPCRRKRVQLGQHVMERLDRELADVTTERHHDGFAGDICLTAASRPRDDGTASRNVATASSDAGAPVVAPPSVAAPVIPPPVAPPPDANQRFGASLARGKMWQNTTDDDQARKLCADLANGGSVQPYIDGTERKSPQLLPQEARQVVEDAVESYCPQYANR
jgi:Protein of unknown function (DUF732)